ncbi:MAG: hypothetical protein QM535_19675 [Limnohabitans sp.]|nr:hypothetical protein [Limnohabitans sp.]
MSKEEIDNKTNALEQEKSNAESLVIYNNWHQQGKTEKNYMDYTQYVNSTVNSNFQYKSYTCKQWSKIQETGVSKKHLTTIK